MILHPRNSLGTTVKEHQQKGIPFLSSPLLLYYQVLLSPSIWHCVLYKERFIQLTAQESKIQCLEHHLLIPQWGCMASPQPIRGMQKGSLYGVFNSYNNLLSETHLGFWEGNTGPVESPCLLSHDTLCAPQWWLSLAGHVCSNPHANHRGQWDQVYRNDYKVLYFSFKQSFSVQKSSVKEQCFPEPFTIISPKE